MRNLVGVPYTIGGDSLSGTDCSGSIILGLENMGFSDLNDYSAAEMASGIVPYITINEEVDSTEQGKPGRLNFYEWTEGGGIKHVNVGVGQKENEKTQQIIDATESDWMLVRNGREQQIVEAGSGQINQTYAPYTSNNTPVIQGAINWKYLMEKKYGK